MLDDQWSAVCLLLENAWPGEFDTNARGAYRTFLDEKDPEAILTALRLLVEQGHRFRPSAAEIVAALNADPSKPTFEEAMQVINRVVSVRPDEAALERAGNHHVYIRAFIEAVGLTRLRTIPIYDPEHGEIHRRELRGEWDNFSARADERVATGRALGERRNAGLKRFDPLKALEAAGVSGPPELPPGHEPELHAVKGDEGNGAA